MFLKLIALIILTLIFPPMGLLFLAGIAICTAVNKTRKYNAGTTAFERRQYQARYEARQAAGVL